VKAVGIASRPPAHGLSHCGKTNTMRSGAYPAIDMIVGHGDRKEDVKTPYVTIANSDMPDAIDRMNFDGEEPKGSWPFVNHL
jgi:hypothetical protein